MNFGSFDHCIEFTRDTAKNIDFDGKYCLVSVQSKDTEIIKNLENYKRYQDKVSERSRHVIQFNIGSAHGKINMINNVLKFMIKKFFNSFLGVCMPSTCCLQEITKVTNKLLKNYGFSILPPFKCSSLSEPEEPSLIQYCAL